jgi:nickel/cobalt transporter (NicO) family protein
MNVVLPTARSHDIPNQRVDRSIQVTLTPGRIDVDYEVSLSELTLTQDLRALTGTLAAGDRAAWLARYAQVTGPLNAKGLLVTVDNKPIFLNGDRYELVVEEHPRYTFHYGGAVPEQGRLTVRDRNYVSSEGTSRLAVRGRGGVRATGDDLPEEVEQIPVRPVWQLTDDEERRTKQVEVRFVSVKSAVDTTLAVRPDPAVDAKVPGHGERSTKGSGQRNRTIRFSELLDVVGKKSWVILALLAVALGAAHAIQPGHGKTLVTAAALGPQARLYQPVLLGMATTLTHMGSVLLVALALWFTGATRVGTIHEGLTRVAGFAIAAAGLWRVGRYLGGHDEHEIVEHRTGGMSHLEVLGLGVAGGLVPCWDAVGLVVLAAALGRLGEGVALVFAFSAGMAFVLIAVGWLAWKFKSRVVGLDRATKWQRGLGLTCGLVLSAVGLYLFLQA